MNQGDIEDGGLQEGLEYDEARFAESKRETDEQQAIRYATLCASLKTMRDSAIKGRAESGIEEIWQEDQEHYDGVDDANRPEKASKPSSMSGSVTYGSREDRSKSNRSTVFVEITRPYVDAAAARVAEMLLPTDDRNWSIVPTPIPDLIDRMKDESPLVDANQNPVIAQDESGQQVQATAADEARAIIEAAKKSCEKAQTRIDDWLTESMYLDECRMVIDDSARIGVGILKGPIPKRTKHKAIIRALEGIGIVIKEEIAPDSIRVDAWNFYPDPDCGEDIQRGKFVFEKDDITGRLLGNLKGVPGYLDDAIDKILEEGPNISKEATGRQQIRNRSDAELYEVWYFHGYMSAEDLDMLGEGHGDGEQFPVIATVVNDKIIKAAISPLDSGEFPYDVFVWQRRPNHWAGKGVSRQMRVEQRGVNSATRALMDNMGESARPHRVINRSAMTQGPDRWTWYTKDGEDVPDVSRAMVFFAAPSMQAELMSIINFWSKKAEDATGLPMLLQGQLGSAPDTVGGMQMLSNNASAVLRRIARNYDARITTRHIGRYYEWLLIHGPDDSEKGDFTVKARGSSALVERDSQIQILAQMVAASKDPSYKLSPARIMAKLLKSQRIDITDVEMTEEEQQQLMQQQQAAGQQQDPRLAVAQQNAQAKQMSEQAETERLNMKLQAENQNLMAELQARQQSEALDRELDQWQTQMESQIEAARLNAENGMNVESLKASLAETTIKLRTQMRLAWQGKAPQVIAPGMEPQGRAPDGEAFQQ